MRILHTICPGTTDAPGARVRIVIVVVLAAVVGTGCRPYRRAALLAASSALVISGVAIATGAPSCGMADPDDPFGGAPCEAARATTIGYGATFITAGVVGLLYAAVHDWPESREPTGPTGSIEERLHDVARSDARIGRCDRVRLVTARLAANHPDYYMRAVASDPALRSCF